MLHDIQLALQHCLRLRLI